MQNNSDVNLCVQGTDEENLVKSYLSLLEDDDRDQLAEIYRLTGTIY